MFAHLPKLNFLRRFTREENGGATVEFVIVFATFMGFLLMIIESGILSVRHVMLERGVDMAVREVRIGRLSDPSRETLAEKICEFAGIIPNCERQLAVEMVVRDLRDWEALPPGIKCTDLSADEQPKYNFTNGANNQLVFLRACVRFRPVMPTARLGKALIQGQGSSTQAQGTYALVATSAYVVEPYKDEGDEDS
ncbi:TadE/TadG family type IV pilus assembly protein [Yoonia sp. 2307UL14-13]|uniref:TadE/TadG family type IV pilus assembly protein n=1 Tax=Yoonia sp. 2307UL14-13 TaxID=3126506 RepID=UPI0030A90068